MTTKTWTIWCDGVDGKYNCSEWVSYGMSILTEARKMAKKDGWEILDKGDLCPKCKEKLKVTQSDNLGKEI